MSTPSGGGLPPGWYPDGVGNTRWWDGTAWTGHVQGAPAPAAPQQPAQPQQPYGAQPYGAQQPYGGQPGYPPAPRKGGGKGWIFAVIGGVLVLGVIAAVVVVILLTRDDDGGGGGGDDRDEPETASPEEVVETYYDGILGGDLETACEQLTAETQEEAFQEYGSEDCADWASDFEASSDYEDYQTYTEDFEIDYEIGEVTEDGDRAEVEVTTTTTYTGDDPDLEQIFPEGGEESVETVNLLMEDGEWKIEEDAMDMAEPE